MCDEPTKTESDVPVSRPVTLHAHSNENLLKIDTHDKYSTVSAIKKFIHKELVPQAAGAAAEGESEKTPLFPGVQRINKNPKNPWLFLAFDTPEHRDAASKALCTLLYRGRPWEEVPVSERDLNLTHKGSTKKRPREANQSSKVALYEQYTMEKQLELKKAHCMEVMKQIVPSRVYGWEAAPDRFLGIVVSPKTEGYRNHVNLSFGFTEDGTPALGFQKGSMMEGTAAIESATEEAVHVITMHPVAKCVAQAIMGLHHEFVPEDKGGLTVFDKLHGTGFWRKLQVRHNVKGEVMIDVELDATAVPEAVLSAVLARLVAVCTSADLTAQLQRAAGSTADAKVVSVQYHAQSGLGTTTTEAARVVLWGDATLAEHACGLTFELSPTAFFQVNTPGLESMLAKVQEVAELSPSTVLLDLCSGTGTIGLTLAKHVKRVIGIELVESAVDNARRNATRNHITNAVFHCGRVEHLLPNVINGLTAEERRDIVAILDPPRAGVNGTVLRWIRGTPTIRRVVYISCEQKALERDCPALTKPPTKAYRGTPFEVSAGFAVDLFPHTHHVEMVAVLTRSADEPPTAVDGADDQGEPVVEEEESTAAPVADDDSQ